MYNAWLKGFPVHIFVFNLEPSLEFVKDGYRYKRGVGSFGLVVIVRICDDRNKCLEESSIQDPPRLWFAKSKLACFVVPRIYCYRGFMVED